MHYVDTQKNHLDLQSEKWRTYIAEYLGYVREKLSLSLSDIEHIRKKMQSKISQLSTHKLDNPSRAFQKIQLLHEQITTMWQHHTLLTSRFINITGLTHGEKIKSQVFSPNDLVLSTTDLLKAVAKKKKINVLTHLLTNKILVKGNVNALVHIIYGFLINAIAITKTNKIIIGLEIVNETNNHITLDLFTNDSDIQLKQTSLTDNHSFHFGLSVAEKLLENLKGSLDIQYKNVGITLHGIIKFKKISEHRMERKENIPPFPGAIVESQNQAQQATIETPSISETLPITFFNEPSSNELNTPIATATALEKTHLEQNELTTIVQIQINQDENNLMNNVIIAQMNLDKQSLMINMIQNQMNLDQNNLLSNMIQNQNDLLNNIIVDQMNLDQNNLMTNVIVNQMNLDHNNLMVNAIITQMNLDNNLLTNMITKKRNLDKKSNSLNQLNTPNIMLLNKQNKLDIAKNNLQRFQMDQRYILRKACSTNITASFARYLVRFNAINHIRTKLQNKKEALMPACQNT